MHSLHERLEHTNVSVCALHPGVIDTPILKGIQGVGVFTNILIKVMKMIGKITIVSGKWLSIEIFFKEY